MRAFSLCALVLVLAPACVSADEKGGEPATAEPVVAVDAADYVQVVTPGNLVHTAPTESAHDLFFVDKKRDMAMAVIIDEPALPLNVLSKTVLDNARSNAVGVNVLSETDALLGGLPARRVAFIFETKSAGPIFFVNLHTATADHNVQVAVWGAPEIRDVVQAIADDMEQGAFSFRSSVVARADDEHDPQDAPEAHEVDWASLPVNVDADAITTWHALKPGTLNANAFLELGQPQHQLWFLGIITPAAELDAGHAFEDLARIMHTQMSLGMTALPPTELGVFDEVGDTHDRRWSLTGLLSENATPILHRFRLVMTDTEVLQMYCWGNATDDVTNQCDLLYAAISPRSAVPPPEAPAQL